MEKSFSIAGRKVGEGHQVYFIAEVGSNHDGHIERAKELIRASKYAGADACKFQSFTAEGLLNPLRPGKNGWETHPAYKVIERLTLPAEWHSELSAYAESIGITFLSAPFDKERAELLHRINVPAYKIASGDLTNDPLLRQVASYKRPVILSTGAAYLDEVKNAVEALKGAGCTELALLHCASLYPPAFDEVNVRSIATLKQEFSCPVGLSDHTPGHTVAVAAITLGASIVEKHITLSRKLSGPDHPYAMEVEEFKDMVHEVRNLELALGDGVKRPSQSEMDERIGARRSIYSKIDIKKGAIITEDMVKLVRHAYGLAPKDLSTVINNRALADIPKDMPITLKDLA